MSQPIPKRVYRRLHLNSHIIFTRRLTNIRLVIASIYVRCRVKLSSVHDHRFGRIRRRIGNCIQSCNENHVRTSTVLCRVCRLRFMAPAVPIPSMVGVIRTTRATERPCTAVIDCDPERTLFDVGICEERIRKLGQQRNTPLAVTCHRRGDQQTCIANTGAFL